MVTIASMSLKRSQRQRNRQSCRLVGGGGSVLEDVPIMVTPSPLRGSDLQESSSSMTATRSTIISPLEEQGSAPKSLVFGSTKNKTPKQQRTRSSTRSKKQKPVVSPTRVPTARQLFAREKHVRNKENTSSSRSNKIKSLHSTSGLFGIYAVPSPSTVSSSRKSPPRKMRARVAREKIKARASLDSLASVAPPIEQNGLQASPPAKKRPASSSNKPAKAPKHALMAPAKNEKRGPKNQQEARSVSGETDMSWVGNMENGSVGTVELLEASDCSSLFEGDVMGCPVSPNGGPRRSRNADSSISSQEARTPYISEAATRRCPPRSCKKLPGHYVQESDDDLSSDQVPMEIPGLDLSPRISPLASYRGSTSVSSDIEHASESENEYSIAARTKRRRSTRGLRKPKWETVATSRSTQRRSVGAKRRKPPSTRDNRSIKQRAQSRRALPTRQNDHSPVSNAGSKTAKKDLRTGREPKEPALRELSKAESMRNDLKRQSVNTKPLYESILAGDSTRQKSSKVAVSPTEGSDSTGEQSSLDEEVKKIGTEPFDPPTGMSAFSQVDYNLEHSLNESTSEPSGSMNDSHNHDTSRVALEEETQTASEEKRKSSALGQVSQDKKAVASPGRERNESTTGDDANPTNSTQESSKRKASGQVRFADSNIVFNFNVNVNGDEQGKKFVKSFVTNTMRTVMNTLPSIEGHDQAESDFGEDASDGGLEANTDRPIVTFNGGYDGRSIASEITVDPHLRRTEFRSPGVINRTGEDVEETPLQDISSPSRKRQRRKMHRGRDCLGTDMNTWAGSSPKSFASSTFGRQPSVSTPHSTGSLVAKKMPAVACVSPAARSRVDTRAEFARPSVEHSVALEGSKADLPTDTRRCNRCRGCSRQFDCLMCRSCVARMKAPSSESDKVSTGCLKRVCSVYGYAVESMAQMGAPRDRIPSHGAAKLTHTDEDSVSRLSDVSSVYSIVSKTRRSGTSRLWDPRSRVGSLAPSRSSSVVTPSLMELGSRGQKRGRKSKSAWKKSPLHNMEIPMPMDGSVSSIIEYKRSVHTLNNYDEADQNWN